MVTKSPYVKYIMVKKYSMRLITITTWQSFSKAPKEVLESFDMVIGDEALLI